MAQTVKPIPEFSLNNIPRKLLPFGEAIMMVARVVNKLVKAHNGLVKELESRPKQGESS